MMSTEVTETDHSYWNVVRAVVRKEALMRIRYPLNTVGIIVMFLLIFSVIFIGGKALAGRALDNSLEGIIVGFFLWMLATTSFVDIGQDIGREAQWGTLERHFVTPFGFSTVLLIKSAVKLFFTAMIAGVLLVIILLLTGERLQLDILTIIPMLVFTISSVFGIGFAIGGLSVLYKRVGSWISFFQFIFAGLIAAPRTDHNWLRLLPLVQGSAMLQKTMREGTRLWSFDPDALALLVGSGIGYFIAGYYVFQLCNQRARKLGVLGDY